LNPRVEPIELHGVAVGQPPYSRAGLGVEPDNAGLRSGLAEAKGAIRQAQNRYKEMWGKDAPTAE